MNVKYLSYCWCVVFCATCIGLLYYGLRDMFSNPRMRNDCKMTYMYPHYTKVPLSMNTTALGPQLAKYNLYTYTEGSVRDIKTKSKLQIQPVLFIPGNAGSYKQVRSIASETARQSKSLEGEKRQVLTKFVFYSIDFDEQFSAFNGKSLVAQTRFTDICVKEILAKYNGNTKLILLGHSMGGVIARGVTKMYKYSTNTISGIVTLNTPHKYPVFAHSMRLNNYYRMLNMHNETENTVNGIPIISVGGGFRDSLVNTKLTDIGLMENKYSAISSSIPGVWASADHQCIVWCNQMMIALDKTLRAISETKQQTRVIKEVNNLLTSKLHSMMIDNIIPKSKRIADGLGITETSKVTQVTELPLTTTSKSNEWYEFDAKTYFDTNNNGRGTVIVLSENAKNLKAYICNEDNSKCLDISQSFEIVVNRYKSEQDPAPLSMLWIDYKKETGLGSHTDMSKLYLNSKAFIPSLQIKAFMGAKVSLPSSQNIKEIGEIQEYTAPSTGIHITGQYWTDKRPLYVRVYSGSTIKLSTYLAIGIFTPANGGHAQEISVQTILNGSGVRIASHYAPQSVDIFIIQLTKAPAPFVVEASLDVIGMVGMALRDSYQFAIAFAVASLLIARIGVGSEGRSTLYTVLVQSPALMIALGTVKLVFGEYVQKVDALRFIGIGEILLAAVVSSVIILAVEVITWVFIIVGKVSSKILPNVSLRALGGLLAALILAIPSFYGIVLVTQYLAFRIERDSKSADKVVPKFARHTLRILVLAALLSMIEAITEPDIAGSLIKGPYFDGYELVVIAAMCACVVPKTATEWLNIPKSVSSLITVLLGVVILVFGTNEYCTACTIAIWANILI